MKDPKDVAEAGLAGVLGAALGGNPQDMLDALQKMLAEARAVMPDNPAFQSQLNKIAAQQAALIAGQGAFEEAQASGDRDRIDAAMAEIKAASPYADPDAGYPPEALRLRDAIDDGDLNAVQAALSGVDLNRGYGRYGMPPLRWALMAETNRLKMVTALLDAGARADFATDEGYTPLHWVSDAGYSDSPVQGEIAHLLAARGGDIAARNHYGWTPLHAAVLEGSVEELAALLAVGADPNLRYTQDSTPFFTRGQTPLMVAIHNPEKIALLLDHGADPLLLSEGGETLIGLLDVAIAESAKPKGLLSKLLGAGFKLPNQRDDLLATRKLVFDHLDR